MPIGRVLLFSLWGSALLFSATVAQLRQQATAAFDQGRLPDAEHALRELLTQTPGDAETEGFLAAVLDREGKYNDAARFYSSALQSAPNSVTILNNAGNHYAAQGNFDEAKKLFSQVLAIRPDHANADHQLAAILSEERKWPDAAAAYEKYLKVRPSDSTAKRNLGFAYVEMGRIKDGAGILEAYCKRFPGDPVALWMLAVAVSSSDTQRSLDLLNQALALRPDLVEARFARAIAYRQLQKYDAALSDALAIKAVDPHNSAVKLQIGLNYLDLGKLAEAEVALEQAYASRQADSATLASLIRVLNARGKHDQAQALYAKRTAAGTNEPNAAQSPDRQMLDFAPTR